MRRVSQRCEEAQKARALLEEAHMACFRAEGRDSLGMSSGPFSGVNEVLGMIALMDEKIHRLEEKGRALEAAAKAATERERERLQ